MKLFLFTILIIAVQAELTSFKAKGLASKSFESLVLQAITSALRIAERIYSRFSDVLSGADSLNDDKLKEVFSSIQCNHLCLLCWNITSVCEKCEDYCENSCNWDYKGITGIGHQVRKRNIIEFCVGIGGDININLDGGGVIGSGDNGGGLLPGITKEPKGGTTNTQTTSPGSILGDKSKPNNQSTIGDQAESSGKGIPDDETQGSIGKLLEKLVGNENTGLTSDRLSGFLGKDSGDSGDLVKGHAGTILGNVSGDVITDLTGSFLRNNNGNWVSSLTGGLSGNNSAHLINYLTEPDPVDNSKDSGKGLTGGLLSSLPVGLLGNNIVGLVNGFTGTFHRNNISDLVTGFTGGQQGDNSDGMINGLTGGLPGNNTGGFVSGLTETLLLNNTGGLVNGLTGGLLGNKSGGSVSGLTGGFLGNNIGDFVNGFTNGLLGNNTGKFTGSVTNSSPVSKIGSLNDSLTEIIQGSQTVKPFVGLGSNLISGLFGSTTEKTKLGGSGNGLLGGLSGGSTGAGGGLLGGLAGGTTGTSGGILGGLTGSSGGGLLSGLAGGTTGASGGILGSLTGSSGGGLLSGLAGGSTGAAGSNAPGGGLLAGLTGGAGGTAGSSTGSNAGGGSSPLVGTLLGGLGK